MNKKILLLALLLAGFTTFLVFMYMKNMESQTQRAAEKKPVVVAKVNIPTKTILKTDMLAIKEIPAEYVPEGVLSEIDAVLDKVLIINAMPGQMLFAKDIQDKKAELGLSFIIPAGKRAVSVQVDPAAGIAGMIKPGDVVDVLVTFEEQGKTVTVLQNVQVLAINQQTEMKEKDNSAKSEGSAIVTLALSLKDSEKLVMASSHGMLHLVLKSVQDNTEVETSGTSIGSIVAITTYRSSGGGETSKVAYRAPVAASKAANGNTVKVYRGTALETVKE